MNSSNLNQGYLEIFILDENNQYPLPNCKIEIADSGKPNYIIEQATTDESGLTKMIDLETPPYSYSMEPINQQPYAEYNIRIIKEGYDTKIITGIQLFSNTKTRQTISLHKKLNDEEYFDPSAISPHTLWGNYSPKIRESEIKEIDESGEIVLSSVVIPEYIVVHDGSPNDSSAKDYYVPYKEYIKNVACCEIYPTWPTETIKANILAILSFTLNRVYTEWYRSQGYYYTITSSTAFDHKWTKDKSIYESISIIVDDIFSSYLSRPNIRQPILTQYCDGKRVSCPNWMTQWGSKYLGDQGYSAIEILRYYYGESMYINESQMISGTIMSWPGSSLSLGSYGEDVLVIQKQLNRIGLNFPLIKQIKEDGIFGQETQQSVETFQKIFLLPETGIVDYKTWYKISNIYVAVTKIAELT